MSQILNKGVVKTAELTPFNVVRVLTSDPVGIQAQDASEVVNLLGSKEDLSLTISPSA